MGQAGVPETKFTFLPEIAKTLDKTYETTVLRHWTCDCVQGA